MDIFQAIVIGILQGVTEWLPISSSGHVVLSLVDFLHVDPETAFSFAIILHTGTLLAVVVKYRKDLWHIIKGMSWNDNLTRFIVVSTIFTGIVGIPIYLFLKNIFTYGAVTTGLVGGLLIFTGIVLYISRNAKGRKGLKTLGFKEMIITGAAQGIAILPGVSRSATTITAMLLTGIRHDTALKLSFIMSVPAIIGAVVLDFTGESCLMHFGVTEVIMGILFAFVFGYLTMDALLKVADRVRFDIFCIIFGLIAVIAFFL